MTNNTSDQDEDETGTGLGGEVDIAIFEERTKFERALPVNSEPTQDAELRNLGAGEEEAVSSNSDGGAQPASSLPLWL